MQEATDSQLLSRLLGGLGLTIGGFRSLVMKSSPTYGEVHVPAPGGERRVRKASDPGDLNPPLNNLDVQLAREALYPEEPPPDESFQMAADAPRRISTVAMVHGDHLLMGKRRDNGKWTCPGGHCDEGEDHHAGALREVEEETGVKLSVDDVEPLTDVHVKPANADYPRALHVQPFVANLDERPSTSMKEDPDAEVHRWQWVDVSGGLPDHIAENLHVPLGDNVLMAALGLAGDGDEDEDDILQLDLGSGTEREPDHVGVDLYPYDDETLVHDLNMGIPFENGTAGHVNLRNAYHDMDLDDRSALLVEICRVLAGGATLSYEGPEALDMPEGMDELEHTQGAVEGADGAEWHKQTFVRQSAEAVVKGGPGSGPQGGPHEKDHEKNVNDRARELKNAKAGENKARRDYVSGKGSKEKYNAAKAKTDAAHQAHIAAHQEHVDHLRGKIDEVKGQLDRNGIEHPTTHETVHVGADDFHLTPEQEANARTRFREAAHGAPGKNPSTMSPEEHAANNHAREAATRARGKVTKSKANAEKITKGVKVAFAKKSPVKQIVYCVVLAPNESDEHEDFMLAEDIEAVAHLYMLESRIVGAEHTKIIKAAPVESYIMPMDMVWEGVNGEPQKVKKGSWCAAIKIFDKREWSRVEDGTYTGLSLSGVGVRDDMEKPGSEAGAVRKDDVPDTSSLEGTLPVPIE